MEVNNGWKLHYLFPEYVCNDTGMWGYMIVWQKLVWA